MIDLGKLTVTLPQVPQPADVPDGLRLFAAHPHPPDHSGQIWLDVELRLEDVPSGGPSRNWLAREASPAAALERLTRLARGIPGWTAGRDVKVEIEGRE